MENQIKSPLVQKPNKIKENEKARENGRPRDIQKVIKEHCEDCLSILEFFHFLVVTL